ncbi:unnamed protein product [marine sediment metagenome]|uniref:Uncharacterized protein n=1 Tax=marine sediment metagenome TaxID=412755 RepID=X1LEJ5_9ZZZZ
MMEKVIPGGIFKDLDLNGTAETGTIYFEVPAGRVVELLYGEYECETSAVVGNRKFKSYIMSPIAGLVLSLFEFTLAASLTKVIDFGIPKITETVIDDAIQLPSRLLMDGGMQLYFFISSSQAGDWFSFFGKYIEWIN